MTRRRGHTLVEVMVVSVIMLTLSLTIGFIYRSMNAANRKSEDLSDIHRTVMVGAARLRLELRGAKIEQPEPGERSNWLSFRHPTLTEDGLLELEYDGKVHWSTPTELRLEDGQLMVYEPGQPPRPLASLGPGSEVTFERKDERVLLVTLMVLKGNSRSQLPLTFYLSNQDS
ncbi:MAG: prepilin-type N-terminal cleavage/methylation domain-containing protein [Candidatus Eremiobacteraeota bacterium]|nr:prepilin-type N-terminal cleavage/methylation domain-containing protein [Candidatus Eremiobacteraeota bacterium]